MAMYELKSGCRIEHRVDAAAAVAFIHKSYMGWHINSKRKTEQYVRLCRLPSLEEMQLQKNIQYICI